MKQIYLLRHGEKDVDGILTKQGERRAKAMRSTLPPFNIVVSSDTDRAFMTANLLTGQEPRTDRRAAYATASPEMSDAINALAREQGISFWDAARLHDDAAVLAGIDKQANALNALIDELLDELPEDGAALIVSHDLTIAPAMGFRGMPTESIDPLSGYVIASGNGKVFVHRYPQKSEDLL